MEEHAVLYFTQGNSNKIYQAQLLVQRNDVDDAWVVNFQYGRRGKALKAGTKTRDPIPYAKAKSAYDKLIQSKLAKGYTPSEDGVAFSNTEHAGRKTAFLPQLLNEITWAEALGLYGQFPVYMQIKHDGERRGIIYQDDKITAANRKGLEVGLPTPIMEDLENLLKDSPMQIILDCEDMGTHLVIFDAINMRKPNQPFKNRIKLLDSLHAYAVEKELQRVRFTPSIRPSNVGKLLLFIHDCEKQGEEGVVIRDGNGRYAAGRPHSGGPCYKVKFYADATCRVFLQHPTKRSITLALLTDEDHWEPVGNCTIPANYPIPEVGNLVEIRYLYAYPGGSLYQPQYKGVRTDVDETAAVLRQLKYKVIP